MKQGRSGLAVLAFAGILAPLAFALVVIIQALVRPEYIHVTMPVSALCAGPTGWIQRVNFVGFGLLLILYAVGLHRGVRPPDVVGPALLAIGGAGFIGAGVWPPTDASGAFDPEASPAHSISSVLAFLSAGIGLIVASRRMARDSSWRSHARFARLSGIGVLALLVAYAALARAPEAPLYPWNGLVQRVLIAIWLASTLVLSFRLLQVARKAERPERRPYAR